MSDGLASSGPFKCVVIGDACVGKTCMVACLAGNKPDLERYEPTIQQNVSVGVRYRDQPVKLEICDTAGQEDFVNLRTTSYAHADLFLLCFSLAERVSFGNLEAAWLSELAQHRGSARVLLVGTKLDIWRPEGSTSVTKSEINALTTKTGFQYAQCSALTQEGIQGVMDKALDVLHGVTLAGGQGRRRRGLSLKKCSIL